MNRDELLHWDFHCGITESFNLYCYFGSSLHHYYHVKSQYFQIDKCYNDRIIGKNVFELYLN